MPTSYPFDPNGVRPGNKILNENITLPVAAFRNYHFIVPQFAPFHKAGLKVRLYPSGIELTENVDYYLTHVFTAARRSVGRPVYGSISFLNKNLAGTVSLDYQTIGGDWTQSGAKIVEILSNSLNNPRITTWDQVADVPYAFPPTNHNWDLEDLKGMDDVIEAIEGIREAIEQSRLNAWNAHIADITTNPHKVNKNQVGLGNVLNYPIATQAQALDATNNATYMTPLRARQLFQTMVDQINSGGGGGGGGTGNVVGPALSVSGNVAAFDGTTGKVITDLEQLGIDVTSSIQRVTVGKAKTNLTTIFSLFDATPGTTRRANFTVASGSLTADRNYTLPDISGMMLTDSHLKISPGTVYYRTSNLTGQGLANSELAVMTSAAPASLVLRSTTGTVTVAPATATGEAVTLGQVNSLFVPLSGHGLVPYTKVVQTIPLTPGNDQLLSVAGLATVLGEYIRREEVGNGGVGEGDVVGPSAALNNSVAVYAGTTGKALKDLQQLIVDVSATLQRLSVGKEKTGLDTLLSLVDAHATNTRRATFKVTPGALSADRNYTLPNRDGELVLIGDVDLDPGTVPFRTTGAAGKGHRDSSLTPRVSADNSSLALRSTTGTLSGKAATSDDELVNLKQVTDNWLPKTGHGLLPVASVLNTVPATPNNTTTLGVEALVTLLEEYVKFTDIEGGIGGGDGAVALDIIALAAANLPYTTLPNTAVVIEDIPANGSISLPATPADKTQVVINVQDIAVGASLTVIPNGSSFYGTNAPNLSITAPYTSNTFQFSETLDKWVMMSVCRYTSANSVTDNAPTTYRGSVTLASNTLPTLANYNLGDWLEISAQGVISGITYPAGWIITRSATRWILSGGNDTTDLEATIDVLIDSFNDLSAALQ